MLAVLAIAPGCMGERVSGPGGSPGSGLDAGADAGREASTDGGRDDGPDGGRDAGFTGIPYVFVIAMENKNDNGIYGNANAPYINGTLMVEYAYALNYADVLPASTPSEPHYVWLEAGTNAFGDHTFTSNGDPSAGNSTNATFHIATQLRTSTGGRTWRAYQEGLNEATGRCPIHSAGFYAAKHNPFVFFQDVAGSPPSATNEECAAHHRAWTPGAFGADLSAGDVATYTFITPDLCHDMHGGGNCTNGCTSGSEAACVSAGDAWLQQNVPPIVDFMNAHGGVLFIVWDEPELQPTQPFLVVGPHVKAGYASPLAYSHSSYVKTLDEIFRLPVLPQAAAANDFGDFFEPGYFP